MAPSERPPEFHVWEGKPPAEDLQACVRLWSTYLAGRRVLDVGCGEGHLLAAFRSSGFDIEGVELNGELANRARAKGQTVWIADAASFIEKENERFEGYLLLDFIEHVPLETASRVLAAIKPASVCIIQTPNTNSILGHQFYLQVPAHVVPYSPFVLERMFERTGFEAIANGTLYGGLPWKGLRRKVTEFLLTKMLGTVTTRLLVEGANYYVVARKRSRAVHGSASSPLV